MKKLPTNWYQSYPHQLLFHSYLDDMLEPCYICKECFIYSIKGTNAIYL